MVFYYTIFIVKGQTEFSFILSHEYNESFKNSYR